MNNNQLQRVTRRQAGMLKLAGFDWETRGNYAGADEELYTTVNPENHNRGEFFVSVPTVALALKWMRDVKDMGYEIRRSTIGSPEWMAYIMSEEFNIGWFDAYESAESALLDELLKLIKK